MPLLVIAAIATLLLAWVFLPKYWRRWQRRLSTQEPFPREWREILKRRMPYFRQMPADLQLQLKRHIRVFIKEKDFVGCEGVVIDDDIRVTIAAQACLLLLNRETDYFPKLKTIYVYPAAFISAHTHTDASGVHHVQHRTLAGESWDLGKVVVSWRDTIAGASDPDDGQNVVIHEFAHQLDQENGTANGFPVIDHGSHSNWTRVFSQAFDAHCLAVDHNRYSVFDAYGATNPSEFFAVATETFFEKPIDFSREHKELYRVMSQFYRVDPLSWR